MQKEKPLSADEIAEKFDLAHFKVPTNLPVSLPSRLVDQRPDVRAAEANMHSASALVGVCHIKKMGKPSTTKKKKGAE